MASTPAFKDHFTAHSAAYQRYRPEYPPALFDWLAAMSPGRNLAIDVGTGNGQAALALAERFDAVIGTEPSAGQLAQARTDPRISYRQEPAEAMSAASHSADLITAAQAAHWFDWPRFTAETIRVLRPGGLLAIGSYGQCEVEPRIDRLVGDLYRDVVGPHWPRERRHVEERYRGLGLPFAPVAAPDFAMRAEWDSAAMLGYIDTWSAVRRCRARTGRDPLGLLAGPLADAWGPGMREVRWPLALRAGRA